MYHTRYKGTHYDAGFKFGSTLRKNGVIIKDCPTFTITEEKKHFAIQCHTLYEAYYPEILQEIRGMADGQEYSYELLCQILFCMYCFELEQHCTCFALSDKEACILGRNSDFLVSLEKTYMNCLYTLDGVFAFNGNTTSFIQMEDGMNEHGLAIGLTFLYPHIQKPGLNAGMLLRYVVEKCKSVEEVIETLQRLPIASAQTFTVADQKGSIAVIECNPEAFEVIYPSDKETFVGTTNNFHTERLKVYRTPIDIDDWRSEERYTTVMEAFRKKKVEYSIDGAQRLLSGEYGFICQYNRKLNADTVWSVVYDVKHKKIYRVEGNPSRKQFKEDTRMNVQ